MPGDEVNIGSGGHQENCHPNVHFTSHPFLVFMTGFIWTAGDQPAKEALDQ
jgi:hypothetical protein